MAVPAYLRIRSDLERQIRSGALPPGTRLPTEAELQQEHSISRTTAQRVLHELAQAGLVERRRRRGTFVSTAARQENLLRLVNPSSLGPEVPGTHVVDSAKVVSAHEADIALPGLRAATRVHELRRVKLDPADEPIAVELTAVPFAVAPRITEEDLTQLTVHDYFARNGVPAATSRVYIEPMLLDAPTADRLRTPIEQPVLRLRRHTWLTNGALAEAMWHLIRPDRMEFFIEQTVLEPETQ